MSDENRPLTPVQENPWYILATLAGEQTGYNIDDDLHRQNRISWNRWATQHLDDTEIAALLESGAVQAEDIEPRSIDDIVEKAEARGLSTLPDPSNGVIFSNTDWSMRATFAGFVFSARADFHGATFRDNVYFKKASFNGYANFEGATFRGETYFEHTTFEDWANFESATFRDWAYFESAVFWENAYFRSATFSNNIHFKGAIFKDWAYFESATFRGVTIFGSATFTERSIFVNAEFKSLTDFDDAKFLSFVPGFFGAKLHEGTTFHRAFLNPKPEDPQTAQEFVDSYERLKLEMNRLNRHEAELDFFALELSARRYCSPKPKAWLISAYGMFSDYGRSIGRPLAWLAGIWIACAALFSGITALGPGEAWGIGQSFGMSATSLGALFGMRREFFPDAFDAETLPWIVPVLSGVESVFGAILVFLLLLALRNRFRIK